MLKLHKNPGRLGRWINQARRSRVTHPRFSASQEGSGDVISQLYFSKMSCAMIQRNGVPTLKARNVTIIGDLNQDANIWQKQVKKEQLIIQTVWCCPVTADAGVTSTRCSTNKWLTSNLHNEPSQTRHPGMMEWFDRYPQAGSCCIICLFWTEETAVTE